MPKQKRDPNAIYISERLQESLRPISHCALTTVVAPMGYGKTTAINWYLSERAESEPLQVIRISVYSDNLAIFGEAYRTPLTTQVSPFCGHTPAPLMTPPAAFWRMISATFCPVTCLFTSLSTIFTC